MIIAMTIRELSTESSNRHVTVTLSYDEVRDIANGLYKGQRGDGDLSDREVYKKAATLFELVKHGKITSHLLSILNDSN